MFDLSDPEPDDAVEEETEENEGGGGLSRLILWLIVLGLGMMLLPMYLVSTTVKDDNLRLATEMVDLQATIQGPAPVKPETKKLTDSLSALQSQLNVLSPLNTNLSQNHINYPTLMATISHYDQGRMIVNSVSETDKIILISGEAENEEVVMSYSTRLRDSEQFQDVTIQSIVSKVLPTATPMPEGVTADPGGPRWSKSAQFVISLALKPDRPSPS